MYLFRLWFILKKYNYDTVLFRLCLKRMFDIASPLTFRESQTEQRRKSRGGLKKGQLWMQYVPRWLPPIRYDIVKIL